jgi:ubiquinone biosynthesis protein
MRKLVKLYFVAMFSLAGLSRVYGAVLEDSLYLSFGEKVLANYALLAYEKPPAEKLAIYQRALKYLVSTYAVEPKTLEVRNFEEFLAQFRGEWPNSGDLDADLKRIESLPARGFTNYTSKSTSVKRKIDFFQVKHNAYLTGTAFGILRSTTGQNIRSLSKLGDNFMSSQLSEFNTIGEKIAETGMSSIGNSVTRIVLQTLFNEYYARQSLDSKKQMISALLDANLKISNEKKLELMIQNSGPQFQKLLQLVARQGGLPEDLKKVFKLLESAVKEVPWWQVEEILKTENENYKFVSFERKALGVGTMAQVHRAKILWNGVVKNVVARFIKPGIKQRVLDDDRILTEVAEIIDHRPDYRESGGPLMKPLVHDITETVQAELDQVATSERQVAAGPAYDKDVFLNTAEYKNIVHFHVPKVYVSKNPSRLMVQELVMGSSLDKQAAAYKESIPGLKKGIVEAMAKIWAEDVIFGSGFYHSDLHQGNFLVQVTDDYIVVNILDYGMGGIMTKKLQKQLMVLALATTANDAELITNGFWDVNPENQISRGEFRSRVQQKIKDLAATNVTIGLEQWLGWASDQGIKLPYDLINLSRGMMIMDNSLQDAGSKKTISSIESELAAQHPFKTYSGVTGTGLVDTADLAKTGVVLLKGQMSKMKNALAPIRCDQLF